MSAAKICPQCDTEYPLDQRFCPLDGAALRSRDASGELVGTIVAERYHVLRKLGEGGMGQVYLAEHVRMGRRSALKVLHPAMVKDADAVSRFNREAANASRISHPNVAAIYDFGETDEGLIYLAMEYVEGEPLSTVVARDGALSPARAGDIVRQAAEALGVAHDMGIVHRDLKPDNIMLTRSHDGSDCVKVVDFGIAKAEGGGTAQKVTKTGLVVGTPEYMSPEQLAGDRLDGRSDIYSLALVAFHLLTGQLPFPSDSAQESMIMRLLEKPRRLADARPAVEWPARLQAVLDRALERDAKLRYAKAAEFGREFARAVERMNAAGAGTVAADAPTVVMSTDTDPAAARTQIMGAAATEVAAAPTQIAAPTELLVPPTVAARPAAPRFGGEGAPPAKPAPLPPIAPGNRMPILVAAAVLVVLGVGAAALKFAGGREGAAPAAGGEVPATALADSAGTPGDPAASSRTGPEGREIPATASTSGTSESAGATPTSAPPAAVTPANDDSPPPERDRQQVWAAVRLRRIAPLTNDRATADDALRRLNRIRTQVVLNAENDTWARVLMAEAYATLDDGARMCEVLGTIRGRATNELLNERVAGLRLACP